MRHCITALAGLLFLLVQADAGVAHCTNPLGGKAEQEGTYWCNAGVIKQCFNGAYRDCDVVCKGRNVPDRRKAVGKCTPVKTIAITAAFSSTHEQSVPIINQLSAICADEMACTFPACKDIAGGASGTGLSCKADYICTDGFASVHHDGLIWTGAQPISCLGDNKKLITPK